MEPNLNQSEFCLIKTLADSWCQKYNITVTIGLLHQEQGSRGIVPSYSALRYNTWLGKVRF